MTDRLGILLALEIAHAVLMPYIYSHGLVDFLLLIEEEEEKDVKLH